ncbi:MULTISPECIES: bifunctional 2-polyprenyl-6-hydroxyphenol methylase/3-demethylubiquinol 3-O-methyltransferase UbiG [Rhizobium/Agrobacterium group]|uniref:SAM-dependent methyltransferase n=1 Tax=Agrobacterium arsenijevicii TaxID=1585697 RepID=A0ABR5D8Y7_9HYPH|nr:MULTISPECIES: class I SAM-dependent methyltransferase [unclassified Rhizobium]KJF73527.1 SAM-dependent methyltransferase [Agrobacterium arsenijevicii]MDH7801651.1 SAM-dependent methyltransferase [Rhizobium sp. AN70]
MTAKDAETIGFYTDNAGAYTSRGQAPDRLHLEKFLARLPDGATILELGCGGGQDSEFMLAAGFDVRPTDGTPEIAKEAELRLGIPVATLLFEDIRDVAAYDGVWANACLLHVPRPSLPGIIGRIHTALKQGGVFYASFKAGEAEGRDAFGRYYNYPSKAWLEDLYRHFGWASLEIEARQGSGYDKLPTDWLHVTATKS